MARQVEWAEKISDPQVVLLGDLFDLIQADMFLRVGETPPEKSSRQRLLSRLVPPKEVEEVPKEESKGRPKKTEAEIRAKLGL